MNSEEKNIQPANELNEDELKKVSGGIWVDVYTCQKCGYVFRCVGPGPTGWHCGMPLNKQSVWYPDIP